MSDLPFDPLGAFQELNTGPMVVAVQWDARGRRALGRVTWWRRQDQVWWAFVLQERATSKSGIRGGWMDADILRPVSHDVFTTHTGWQRRAL